MSKVGLDTIKELRHSTGAGVMDCKKALKESGGDFTKAVQILKKRGIAIAAKKAGRTATQGRIEAYTHINNKVGAMVEVACETDFVARCQDFKKFSRDIAMQVVALTPQYISREDVPAAELKKQHLEAEEFYRQNCLLEQTFIKDDSKTVKDYLTELIGKIGENIFIKRFVRYQLGE